MKKQMKNDYATPQLTVVSFVMEQGFQESGAKSLMFNGGSDADYSDGEPMESRSWTTSNWGGNDF